MALVGMANATEYYGTESLYTFHHWYAQYHGYVSVVVCVIGVVCNLFNIAVLTRRNMWNTTNYILTALAVSDLLTMLPYIPFALQFYVLHGLRPSPRRNTEFWAHYFLFHVNFSVTAHTVSIWLGVRLSAFRYAYVKLSSRTGNRCGVSKARVAIMAVYTGSVIILVPNYLSMGIQSRHDYRTNATIYDLASISPATEYGGTVTTMNFWIHALVIKLIPCGLMLVFGLLLICTMRVSHRRGRKLRNSPSVRHNSVQSSTRRKDHSRTTYMLVIVVVLFLLTELPQGVLALCSGLLPGFFDAFYVPLGDAMDIVALINNGINFTLYCSMSRQFRETFLRLFAPCFLPPEKRNLNGVCQYSDYGIQAAARRFFNKQREVARPSVAWSTM